MDRYTKGAFDVLPMAESGYYFLICINFPKRMIEIINHAVIPTTLSESYCKVAKTLVKILSVVLKRKRPNASIEKFKVNELDMNWKSKRCHYYDSGIYCIRHIETYFGDSENWISGFKKTNEPIIDKLRIRYSYTILNSDANELKAEVMKKATSEESE